MTEGIDHLDPEAARKILGASVTDEDVERAATQALAGGVDVEGEHYGDFFPRVDGAVPDPTEIVGSEDRLAAQEDTGAGVSQVVTGVLGEVVVLVSNPRPIGPEDLDT